MKMKLIFLLFLLPLVSCAADDIRLSSVPDYFNFGFGAQSQLILECKGRDAEISRVEYVRRGEKFNLPLLYFSDIKKPRGATATAFITAKDSKLSYHGFKFSYGEPDNFNQYKEVEFRFMSDGEIRKTILKPKTEQNTMWEKSETSFYPKK